MTRPWTDTNSIEHDIDLSVDLQESLADATEDESYAPDFSKLSPEELRDYFALRNAKVVVQGNAKALTEHRSQRKSLLATFAVIRKCLSVIIDENLMTFVIFGDKIIKDITKQVMDQALTSISDETRQLMEDAIEDVLISEDMDSEGYKLRKGTTKKLVQVLHDKSDEYLMTSDEERRDTVEKQIDNVLSELSQSHGGETGSNGVTDVHLLLEWFENVVEKET